MNNNTTNPIVSQRLYALEELLITISLRLDELEDKLNAINVSNINITEDNSDMIISNN